MRLRFNASTAVTAALLFSIATPIGAKDADDDRAGEGSAELARGRYLVQIAGCNDCHTPEYVARNGSVDEADWLTGSRVGFEGPWGTTYPANLRLLASELTRDEWLIHARKPTRPPMPWFTLRRMTDQDLTAVYRFIRALGPAGKRAPAYEPPKEASDSAVVRRWRAE